MDIYYLEYPTMLLSLVPNLQYQSDHLDPLALHLKQLHMSQLPE